MGITKAAFFTNSTFNGIPPLLYLVKYFRQCTGKKVQIVHTTVKGVSVFNQDEVELKPVAEFDNIAAMLSLGSTAKIKRYLKLLLQIIRFQAANRDAVLYCIDLPTANMILFTQFFFFSRNKVIYHQFEMYDPALVGSFDRKNFSIFKKLGKRLNMVIIPEINRLKYFKDSAALPDKIPAFILPNSNAVDASFVPAENKKHDAGKIVIGHIGSLGSQQHFIKEYVEALRGLPENFHALFAGRITPDVKLMLQELGDRVEIHDHVMQSELKNVFARIDIGIILYHPFELNTRYAAPTKMYEYWSCGIPVIAHNLISLEPLFKDPLQGKLTDMQSCQVFKDDILSVATKLESWDRPALRQYFKDNFEMNKYLQQLDVLLKSSL